jgi:hypothetical protein
MLRGLPIVWQQWLDAVQWDRTTNSRLLHYKASDTHLHPSHVEKMRNHLAEEMMDDEMLNLMLHYQVLVHVNYFTVFYSNRVIEAA